ncbi:MAG: transketolase [Dermatophilaceae bacterium]|nr:transketolase [Dermatophilaceae bacterium]
MRERFAATACKLLDQDRSVAVVLADISASMFAEAAARHPDRVVNVGIREQLLVNVGAGMAMTGMRPVVHTFATFLVERGFEQVKLGFAHQGVGGVLVSAGASYDMSRGGRTHQAPGDVALLDTLPDWTIHVPGHPDEVDTLLRGAVAGDGMVYLRTSTQQNTAPMPVDGSGTMMVVRRGSGGTVVAVGPMLDPVLSATEGIDVTVLYATTVRPFDAQTLISTLGSAEVILVEPYLAGTSTRCVAEALAHVSHRVLGLGVPRVELRRYGRPEEHAAALGLDAAGVCRRVTSFLGLNGTLA